MKALAEAGPTCRLQPPLPHQLSTSSSRAPIGDRGLSQGKPRRRPRRGRRPSDGAAEFIPSSEPVPASSASNECLKSSDKLQPRHPLATPGRARTGDPGLARPDQSSGSKSQGF